VVEGDVGDIGEAVFLVIPFERVINKTFPRRCNPLLSNQGALS
jgi:hypothetical protein